MFLSVFKLKIYIRYILKEFLFTTLICFLFFLFIFIINDVLVNIKPLLEKNIPLDLVASMLFSLFPFHIIMSLPFGVMLSTLMVMGRFSTDNEIVAFRALGFHIMQVFGPIFIIGFLISLGAFYINDQLVPIGMQERKKSYIKTRRVKPTMDFKSKTVKRYKDFGKVIFTDLVRDTDIEGMIVIDRDSNGQKRIISSRKAEMLSPDYIENALEIAMEDAMVQFENQDRPGDFNFGYSDKMSYIIRFLDFEGGEVASTSINEKVLTEIYDDVQKAREGIVYEVREKSRLYLGAKSETILDRHLISHFNRNSYNSNSYRGFLAQIDGNLDKIHNLSLKPIPKYQLNYNLIELYRKFAFPLACIIFIIFAAPIGIYSKRAGFSIGFVLGLILTAIYWFTYYGCWILGRKNIIPPFWSQFLPNTLFLILGLFFLIKRLRE